MKTTRKCAKEDELVAAVKEFGFKEVRISASDPILATDSLFIVAVVLRRTGEELYLATRRNPYEPRKFKRVDVAIAAMVKLIDATRFTVTLDQ